MYSTWRSVESAGYCDLTFFGRELGNVLSVTVIFEVGVKGAWVLPFEAPRCVRGEVKAFGFPMPLRTEPTEAVREEGKDDSDAWRVTPLPTELAVCAWVRPLVEGREGMMVAICRTDDAREPPRRMPVFSTIQPLEKNVSSKRIAGLQWKKVLFPHIRWEHSPTPHNSVVHPSPPRWFPLTRHDWRSHWDSEILCLLTNGLMGYARGQWAPIM